jgi:hypothetical protein
MVSKKLKVFFKKRLSAAFDTVKLFMKPLKPVSRTRELFPKKNLKLQRCQTSFLSVSDISLLIEAFSQAILKGKFAPGRTLNNLIL